MRLSIDTRVVAMPEKRKGLIKDAHDQGGSIPRSERSVKPLRPSSSSAPYSLDAVDTSAVEVDISKPRAHGRRQRASCLKMRMVETDRPGIGPAVYRSRSIRRRSSPPRESVAALGCSAGTRQSRPPANPPCTSRPER